MAANVDFISPKNSASVSIYPVRIIPENAYTSTAVVTCGTGDGVNVNFNFKRQGDVLAIAHTSFTTNGSATIATSATFPTDPNHCIIFDTELISPLTSYPTSGPTVFTAIAFELGSLDPDGTQYQATWTGLPLAATTVPSSVFYYSYHATVV
jgi:hypothetical protein